MAKIKVFCTIGPSSRSPKVIRGLIDAGADALRVNLSHTPMDSAKKIIATIRKISKRVPIIIDTQGKEVRLGARGREKARLRKGARVLISHPLSPKKSRAALYFSRADILLSLKRGDRIFADDNDIRLDVIKIRPEILVAECLVVEGGVLGAAKNIRLENNFEPKTMLTALDKKAIFFAKEFPPYEVALSYVARAEDVKEAKKIIGNGAMVTSKIETRSAIKNLTAIAKESDMIAIDRNDLGTNIGFEKIPSTQKEIIGRCRKLKKPVFVATHILETMITNKKPTRGELNDIYNTILDGADGLILSSETAIGKDPVHILKTLKMLVRTTNQNKKILTNK